MLKKYCLGSASFVQLEKKKQNLRLERKKTVTIIDDIFTQKCQEKQPKSYKK